MLKPRNEHSKHVQPGKANITIHLVANIGDKMDSYITQIKLFTVKQEINLIASKS